MPTGANWSPKLLILDLKRLQYAVYLKARWVQVPKTEAPNCKKDKFEVVKFFFIGPPFTNICTPSLVSNEGDLPPGVGAQTRPL